MSDDIERTLCQLPHVHVFRIPVRKSAEGHRASDWPKDPAWTGKLKIVAKGKVAAIILMDSNGQVFAVCKVTDDSAVERTLDSGRYFVLRITNDQGRHAFIGIAFNERNDAFDFNVALSEFKSELEREELANKLSHDVPVGPMKDLSLKEGEKIKIKIAVKKKHTDEESDPFATPAATQSPAPKPSGGGLLAPPKGMLSPPPAKGSFATAQAASAPRPTATTSNSSGFDDFGSFSSDPFASSTPTSTANNHGVFGFGASSSSSNDPFASDPFGSDPFGSTSSGSTVKAATPAKPLPAPGAAAAAAVATPGSANKGDVANLLDF